MIEPVLYFYAGSLVLGIFLEAAKLHKPLQALMIGGVPFHELSHFIACVSLGVKVHSITLLNHDDKRGFNGNVTFREDVHDPFTAFVVSVAPAIGALFWTFLFAWGIGAVSEAGYDWGWSLLLVYLAIATGACATPSRADWRVAWNVIRSHPGQFMMGLIGSILAGWICVLAGFPLVEWWHLALLVTVVLGPGIASSKLYKWRRG